MRSRCGSSNGGVVQTLGSAPDGTTAPHSGSPAAAHPRATEPGQGGAVLYLLPYLPTYVAWELEELARRGVEVCVVLSAPWPRAVLWDRITGFAPGAAGTAIRRADFHAWLTDPARSLAPALIAGNFSDLWIYLVAPVVGAAIAVAAWTLVARPGSNSEALEAST